MDQMNAAALLAFPVLLFGAYLIDQSHTVVRDFRVVTSAGITPRC